MHENNLVKVISQLNLKVDPEVLASMLFNHTDFPNLLCISDVLNSLAVRNYALKFSVDRLSEINVPFICYCKNGKDAFFVLVRKINFEFVELYDSDQGWIKQKREEFEISYQGVALALIFNENSGDINFLHSQKIKSENARKVRYVYVPVTIAIFLVLGGLVVKTLDFKGSFLLILNIVGLTLSYLMLTHEYAGKYARAFCSLGPKDGCESVLKSSASKLFGHVPMSFLGFIWFSSFVLLIIFGTLFNKLESFYNLINSLNIIAAFYIPFSIIYQWLKIKNWCILCLSVQLVLFLNLLFTINAGEPLLDQNFVILLFFATIMLIATLLSLFVGNYLKKDVSLKNTIEGLKKFRTDKKLFSSYILFDELQMLPLQKFEFISGEYKSPIKITIVLSLFCISCADALRKFHEELELFGDKFSYRVVFAHTESIIEKAIGQRLLLLPEMEQMRAIEDWFDSKDFAEWNEKYSPDLTCPDGLIEMHYSWTKKINIASTPSIFINNVSVSEMYDIDDIILNIRRVEIS